MTEPVETMSTEAAEKAYEAAAAEAVAKAEAVTAPAPLAFPAKEERAAAPHPETLVETLPVTLPETLVTAAAPAKPAKKVAAPKKPAPTAASTPVTASPIKATPIKASPIKAPKEKIMTAKKTTDFTTTIKTYAADAQAKAKVALAKGSVAVSEVTEFTKGNVDAVVASGKILGAGLQGLGKTYAAEGKAAVETVTADVKAIAAVKSPVEFVQAQSAILKKNFDHAIDFNAKTGETIIKLFGDVFAPLSVRANLMVAKVKKAA